jgi:hypothetical protein
MKVIIESGNSIIDKFFLLFCIILLSGEIVQQANLLYLHFVATPRIYHLKDSGLAE